MAKIIVYHGGYGCETGCCGHWVRLTNDKGETRERFKFKHAYGKDPKEFAKAMVESAFGLEHCADLDWENCVIVDGVGNECG